MFLTIFEAGRVKFEAKTHKKTAKFLLRFLIYFM